MEDHNSQYEEEPKARTFRFTIYPKATIVLLTLALLTIFLASLVQRPKLSQATATIKVEIETDSGLRQVSFPAKLPNNQLITVNFFYIKGAMKNGQAELVKETLKEAIGTIDLWTWQHGDLANLGEKDDKTGK